MSTNDTESVLVVGSTNSQSLVGLKDEDTKVYPINATVKLTGLFDASGAVVPGTENISMPYVSGVGSKSLYRGAIPHTVPLVGGVTYTRLITATDIDGNVRVFTDQLPAVGGSPMAIFRYPLPPAPVARVLPPVIRGEVYVYSPPVGGFLSTDVPLQAELIIKPDPLVADTDLRNVRIRINTTASHSGQLTDTISTNQRIANVFIIRPAVTLRMPGPGYGALRITIMRSGVPFSIEETVELPAFTASGAATTTDPAVIAANTPSFVTLTSPYTSTEIAGFSVTATAYEDDGVTVMSGHAFTFASSDPEIADVDSNGTITFGGAPFGGDVRITATDAVGGLTASVTIEVLGSWKKLIRDLGGDAACVAAYFPDPASVETTAAGLITQINDVRGASGYGPPLLPRAGGRASIANFAFHCPANTAYDSGPVSALDNAGFAPFTVCVVSTVNPDSYGSGVGGPTAHVLALWQRSLNSGGSDARIYYKAGAQTDSIHSLAIRPPRPDSLVGSTRPAMIAGTLEGQSTTFGNSRIHVSGVTDVIGYLNNYFQSGNTFFINGFYDHGAFSNGAPLEDSISCLMIWNKQFSEGDNRIFDIWAHQYCNAKYSLSSGSEASWVGYDGNSIMAGYPGPSQNSVMNQVNRLILAAQGETVLDDTTPTGWRTVDTSVVGLFASSQSVALTLLPYVNNFNSSSIAIVQEGTNALQSLSAAATEAYLRTTCEAYWDAGLKPIIMTTIKADPGSRAAGFDARRVAMNALIMADWPQYAFAVCDVATNSALQDPTDSHYTGGLHLTLSGEQVVAAQLLPIIQAVRAMEWHARAP